MICLDTHVLLWWALDPSKLSKNAVAICRRMEKQGGCASAISLWELGLKIKNGRLDIGMEIEEFARRIQLTGVMEIVPASGEIWMENLRLDWSHRDPADRTIVATARSRGFPLLTKDEIMHAYPPARALW